jgi:hypothetical protein
MNAIPTEFRTPPVAPPAVAISGIIFSVLFTIGLVLIRLTVPAAPTDPGEWIADASLRAMVRWGLNLVPFAGLAFLWFMAALRNRIGDLEDRFLATVFLGSGLLFVAMLMGSIAGSTEIIQRAANSPLNNRIFGNVGSSGRGEGATAGWGRVGGIRAGAGLSRQSSGSPRLRAIGRDGGGVSNGRLGAGRAGGREQDHPAGTTAGRVYSSLRHQWRWCPSSRHGARTLE